MTMNVSVRVPDGIALASDSLATSLVQVQPQVQLGPIKCDKCGEEKAGGLLQMPPLGVPGSSTPLASKLLYIANYGITFFGASSICSRTLFNHVMMFRTKVYRDGMELIDIAQGLATQLNNAANQAEDLKKAKKGTPIGGFQVSGYDQSDVDVGRTVVVTLSTGEAPKVGELIHGYGVTVTGQQDVVKLLFAQQPGNKTPQPRFESMTLPDAIDYARFLVQTTTDYYRFADIVPLVGGPTDVAVITKWIGFRWIERKKLLGDDTTRLNIGKISHEIEAIRNDLPDIIRRSREPVGE